MAQAPATRDNQGDNVDKRASNEEHSCAQEVQGPFPTNSWLISRPLCQVKEANGKGPSDSSWRLQEDCMCGIFLGGNENVLQLVVATVAQFWETTACH